MSDSKSNCPYIAPRPHWPPVKSLVPLRRGKEGIDDGSQRTIEHPQGKDGIHARCYTPLDSLCLPINAGVPM